MKEKAMIKVSWSLIIGLMIVVLTRYAWSLEMDISQADYGKDWPLTAPEATLYCELNMVWVVYSRVAYPVNGMASAGLAKRRPSLTVRPLEDIWLYDDRYPGTGLRINISPLIDDGLKLCKRKH